MATRTLTEFAGTQIRMAAKAEAEARKALPPELKAVVPASVPVEAAVTAQPTSDHKLGAGEVPHAEPEVDGGPGEKSESGAFSSATEAADEAASIEKAAEEPAAAAAPVASKDEPAAETDAVKALLDKAVSEATGTTGDRLDRLREALKAAGRQVDRIRLVRVFGGEDVVAGAKKIGEHQYLVDLMPASMKQTFKDPKDEKGFKRGPARPTGSTKNKDGSSLEGSFSMESLAADRKNERGPGGPGRRPGGPGGGKPGGRPGGAPGGRPGGRPGGAPGGGRGKPSPKP